MNSSYLSIFIASILGSVHCAGMCGGFATFCSNLGTRPSASLLCYHLGRLISYVALGLLAGLIGESINNSAAILGIQKATSLLTGAMLIVWGIGNFFQLSWFNLSKPLKINPDGTFGAIFKWIHLPGRPLLKTSLLGLCSGLLPCGWLYTFVALAITTNHPLSGGLLMAVFWLGTVPILSMLGGLSHVAVRYLGPQLPKVVGILLIVAGLFSLNTHISHNHDHSMHNQHHHSHKH